MLDLKQVRNFIAVAETLNYRAAAERLHMAQPPLSASIRNFEESLGCTLFERSRRGTVLTPVGRVALEAARRTLFEARQFENIVRDAAAGLGGTLSIGYVPSAVYELLPKILPLHIAAYPQTRIKLVEHSSETILDAIEQHAVDIGFMRTPMPRPTDAFVEFLQKDPFIVALPDVPRWHDLDEIDIAALSEEPFVSFATPYVRSLSMRICEIAGFTPKVAQEATGLPTVICLVQSGLGIALVPRVAQGWSVPGVLFKPLQGVPKGLELGLAMAWSSRESSGLVQRFCDLVTQAHS